MSMAPYEATILHAYLPRLETSTGSCSWKASKFYEATYVCYPGLVSLLIMRLIIATNSNKNK